MNLPEQFVEYLNTQKKKPSKATVKNYKADISQFIRWFENRFKKTFEPLSVTPQIIELYKSPNITSSSASGEKAMPQLSPRSLKRHASSLRKFFYFLKIKGIIANDPTHAIEINKKAQTEEDKWRLKDFKNYLYVYNASPLTIKNYIMDTKQFARWAEKVTGVNEAWQVQEKNIFDKIDWKLIEEYKLRLIQQRFSPLTINRKLSSLRKFISWAKEEGLIKKDTQITSSQFEELRKTPQASQVLQQQYFQAQAQPESPKQEETTTYSAVPPVRLAQKTKTGLNTIFDSLIIEPITLATRSIQNILWKTKGKPVFQTVIKEEPNANKVSNISKQFYAPISTKNLPFFKKTWYTIRYKRPRWYSKYNSYPAVRFIRLVILIIIISLLSFSAYRQFFTSTTNQPFQATVVKLGTKRILLFKGVLTDSKNNPLTSTSPVKFSIYDKQTASGSNLLWSETNTITPNKDGSFSVFLGNKTPLFQEMFVKNYTVWLGIAIGSSPELTPRQQLTNVALSENSQRLDGMLPITQSKAGTNNVVLALDSSGNLTIGGQASSTFQATGGEFTLSGNVLSLTTVAGTNSDIILSPDGLGKVDIQKPIFNSSNNTNPSGIPGAVEIDDLVSILASSSGQSALTINQTGGGALISASSSGIAKFTVDNLGDTTMAGSLFIGGAHLTAPSLTDVNFGNSSLEIGSITTSGNFSQTGNTTFSTGTGSATLNGNVTLGDNSSNSITFNGTVAPNSSLVPSSTNGTGSNNLGSPTSPWTAIYANSIIPPSGGSGQFGWWTRSGTTLSPANAGDNLSVGGTLAVTGATTLSSTLGVTGATTLLSTLGVTGATTLSSTLGVTGATLLSSTLGVTGATALSSTLGVSGATTLSSTETVSGLISANGGVTIPTGQNLTLGGLTSNGGVLYTNGSGVVAQSAAGTTTQVLHGGATPSFGAVSLTGDVSGILPIANGGTNSTSTPTAGAIAYGTGTAFDFSSAGTAGQFLISGGAGAPTWTSTITATSLPFSGITSGTNTTAAMVVGTGASLGYTGTGTIDASSLIGATWNSPGAIGTVTPAAGNFTTIGATTQGTGTFTALTANTSITDSALNTAGVVTNTAAGLLGTLAGTSNTVLHGNAAGLPTYSSIVGGDLASNITISTTGNISTTGTGTITSAGLLTASNGFTLTTGALNLTSTSGALSLSGLGASSINTGANALTITSSNFNTTATGINNTAIGATTPSTGAFTTISASGQITSTLATGTAPFVIASTTVSTNLNADLLDGQHGAYYAPLANISGTTNYVAKFTGANSIGDSVMYDDGTNVGIGTIVPSSKLDVKGEFRISGSASGYVGFVAQAAAGAVTYTLPNADGTNNYVLTTDGAGNLSWSDKTGGTPGTINSINGDNSSAQTIAAGAGLQISNVGPVHTLSIDYTYAGNWTATQTFSNGTYSALFTGGNVGIGTITPNNALEILSTTTPQLRVAYDTSNYYTTAVSNAGAVTFDATGASAGFTFADPVTANTFSSSGATITGGSINATTIGASIPSTGAFTTLTSSGNSTIGTGASSINTIGSVTTPGTLTLHGATTLDNTFTVSGANLTTLGGNLNLSGAFMPGNLAGTAGQFLISSGPGVAPTWTSTIVASSMPFSGITSGTNTTATMLVGTGASLDFSGTGTINASSLLGGTWAIPGAIGSTVPNTGAFTTISASGQITSTLATGTAPFVVASTTNVANLNASSLNGATFASPGPIGSVTPSTGAFTTLTSSDNTTLATGINTTNTFGSGASSINTIGSVTTPGTLTLHGATTLDNTFTVSGANLTTLGGNLTFAGANPAISASTLNTNISLDANGTGTVNIAGTSTGDVNLAGGSGLTGCTITNSTGTLACSGDITSVAVGTPTVGFWTRNTASGYLYPTTLTDIVGIGTAVPGANLDIYGASTTLKNTYANGTLTIGADNGGSAITSIVGSSYIAFSTYNGGWNEKLRITSGGNVGIGTTAPGALLDLGLAGTTLGVIRLAGSTSGNVTVEPAAIAGTWTLTLPTSGGTNGYFLQTDGSGVTSWVGSTASSSWNAITDPVGNQSLNMGTFTTTWTSADTTGGFFNATGNSLQSGNLFSITSTSTDGVGAGSSTLLNIARSGANANASHTAYGIQSTVTNTGATSTNIAGYFSASGATNNYAIIVPPGGGSVGIGTTTPDNLIQVAGLINFDNTLFNTLLGYQAGNSITTGTHNSFIGYQAGFSDTSGSFNSFIGDSAGYGNTTGFQNLFVGVQAGSDNTSGAQNVFLGNSAGLLNSTGSLNTFVGESAGLNNTASSNTFIGNSAGLSNTSGTPDTFVGANSGFSNTTGAHNTFFGFETGFSNTTGSFNSFFGESAGYANTTGSNNLFMGLQTGSSNTTASNNTLVGISSGLFNTTGASNTFVGESSGFNNTTASNNTFVGDQAGFSNMTGTGNVFMGYLAGDTATGANANVTGNNNTFIGYQAGPGTATQLTNAGAIGYNATVTASNSLILGGTGANVVNVGIGITNPATDLSTVGNVSSAGSAIGTFSNNNTTDSANTVTLRLNTGASATATTARYVTFYNGVTSGDTGGAGAGHINTTVTGGVNYGTSGADFGERFLILEPTEFGDIITQDNGINKKATSSNDIIGVVSDATGFTGNDKENVDQATNPTVGLLGQVKTKVSTENGPINSGDYITSSSIPGVGAKATKAGRVVGIALESYNGNGTGKIKVFVNPTWYDPDVYLTDTGNLSILPIASINAQPYSFALFNGLGQTIDRVGAFAQIAVANLKAGAIDAKQITTDNLNIGGQNIHDYIAGIVNDIIANQTLTNSSKLISPIAEIDQLHTNLISPLASNSAVAIKLDDNKVSILNGNSVTASAVASIDNQGNATFSGQLTSGNLNTNDATISGTLHADTIIANNIQGLDAKISTLSANTIVNNYFTSTPAAQIATPAAQLATPSANLANNFANIASFSGQLAYVSNLNAETATFNQGLIALGPSSLMDTSIVGQLSINSSLVLADNSINVLGADLEIQPFRQGGISFLSGLIHIDTDGNLTVGGNAEFAKNVKVNGILSAGIISPLQDQDLVINLPQYASKSAQLTVKNSSGSAVLAINSNGDLTSSGSATFNKLNFNLVAPALALDEITALATGSAGVATISAHQTQLTINNNLVTDKSLIYITPVGNPGGQTPFLLRQMPNTSFTAGIQLPSGTDTAFNWLIIN